VNVERVRAGSDGLIFLPYLSGGRSPDNDPRAKGVFMGLTTNHTRAHLIRSTMEGVIYSLKQSMEILKSIVHREPDVMIASGGGARGELFLQMEADAFNKPIYTTLEAEQSCIGAAATAAVGVGYFHNYEEAVERVVHLNEKVTLPIPEHVATYNEYYDLYVDIYSHVKDLFWRYPA
jgi:xylulokinase